MESVSDKTGARLMRRRAFLINKKFQLKYTFVIVLVGVAVSAILGYFVYRMSSYATDMATMDQIDAHTFVQSTGDLQFMKKTKQEIQSSFDSQVLYGLFGFVGIMALFLFLWGILITHRVAGPVYLLSGYFQQLAQGQAPKLRPLRRGDELKDFFGTFSEALEQLKQVNLAEAELLENCVRQIRDAQLPSLSSAAEQLEELALRKKTWEEVGPSGELEDAPRSSGQ